VILPQLANAAASCSSVTLVPEVLHQHVGEGPADVPLLGRNVVGDDEGEALGRSQLLAVGGLHGTFSLLTGLVLNEAEALRLAVIAGSDLAGQDVAELEKVSKRSREVTEASMFLMKMFPAPDLRMEGSRCFHMMRRGLPLIT